MEMAARKGTYEIGPIRPPSEAYSLLLRVTRNCPWNRCKFCTLYKTEQFGLREVDEIKADIDTIAFYYSRILQYKKNGSFHREGVLEEYGKLSTNEEKDCFSMVFRWMQEGQSHGVFLQDGNSIVLQSGKLAEVIRYLREKLPEVQRVTSYGRADTLSRISAENFVQLKEAGLNRIHSGFESGSDKVLQLIGKGTTQEQQIMGGQKVKEAGIELSIYFMPGAGGRSLSEENALETARVIERINPDFVRLRTFVVKAGSLMEAMREQGEFDECTDIEKVKEIKLLLEHITGCSGYLASDQIINLLEGVKGNLSTDLPGMISYINTFLELPQQAQREFQLARRMGFQGDWEDMKYLSPQEFAMIQQICLSVQSEQEWEKLLHNYLERYI